MKGVVRPAGHVWQRNWHGRQPGPRCQFGNTSSKSGASSGQGWRHTALWSARGRTPVQAAGKTRSCRKFSPKPLPPSPNSRLCRRHRAISEQDRQQQHGLQAIVLRCCAPTPFRAWRRSTTDHLSFPGLSWSGRARAQQCQGRPSRGPRTPASAATLAGPVSGSVDHENLRARGDISPKSGITVSCTWMSCRAAGHPPRWKS